MEKQKIFLWAIIGILLIAVIYTVFFKISSTGNSVNSGEIDTSDWTENEIMNYEMHGTIPVRLQGKIAASSTGTGMVGGC
jgi:hypothetical protein